MSNVTRARILRALFVLSRSALALAVGMALVVGTAPVVGQDASQEFDAEGLFGGTDETTTETPDTALDGNGLGPDLESQAEAEAEVRARAEEAFREAQRLAEEGKYEAAIEQYTRIGSPRELGVLALVERGKCFAELEEYDQAVQSFAMALQGIGYEGVAYENLGLRLELHQVILERGKAMIDGGRMADAMVDLSQAIDLKPSDPELYYYRGLAYSRQAALLPGRERYETLQTAVASFDRAIDLNENYAEAYFERGNAKGDLSQLTGEDWDEAVEDLEKARELDPENQEYVLETGVALLRRARQQTEPDAEELKQIITDHEKAIEAFDQFIEKHPERLGEGSSSENGTGPSDLFAADQSASEAEEDEEEPTLEDGYVMRADARVSLAKYLPDSQREPLYRAAISDCNAALEIEPKQYYAFYNRGVAWRLLEDYDQAIDDLTKSLKLAGGFTPASLRRGIIWYRLGEFELALQDFEHAMLGAPDGRAKFWAGACHAEIGQYETAVELYSDALRENPAYTLAYNNRGLAYLHLGLYERARDDFNELVRRDRTNAKAYRRLGLAYRGLGRDSEAKRSFQRANQLDPTRSMPAG